MGRYYQERDNPLFDYGLATTGDLAGWELRGPIPDLQQPYFVCVGATQVFGRFCARPFPQILSEELGLPVLNLGLGGHGPRTFLNESLISAINGALFAIVQLGSARVGSNSLFENSATGRAPGVRHRDGRTMMFDEFLAEEFVNSPHEVVARLVQETRDSWVSSYRALLGAITVPTIMHWLSGDLPQRADDYSMSVWELLGTFPQLVNGRMINQVRLLSDAYVETVCRKGLPQALWEATEQVSGTELRNGRLYNTYYPSPEMHQAAAENLLRPARALAGSRRAQSTATKRETLVVSCTLEGGRVVSGWCGPRTTFVTYGQVEQDHDLLSYLLERRPLVIHVKRRSMLKGYLQRRSAEIAEANMPPPADVDPLDFLTFARTALAQEWRVARLSRFQNVLELLIEDCAGDPPAALSTISDFIARPLAWSTEMPRVLPFDEPPVQNRAQLEIILATLLDGVRTVEV